MKNSKRYIIYSSLIALAIILFTGISVYAASNVKPNKRGNDFKEANSERFEKDKEIENLTVGKIDSVNDDSITITLGELEKPENMSKENQSGLSENKENEKSSNDKITSPNFEGEESEDSQPTPPNFEGNEGEDGQLTTPNFEDKENNLQEKPDFKLSDKFKEGTEKLTLKVTDAKLVENLKAGDIVTLNYEGDTLTSIRLLDDGPQKDKQREQNKQESAADSNTVDSSKAESA